MKLVDLICPGCGAELKVNSELKKCNCNFCGREFIIDDEINKNEITNGRELGFQQEQGRQDAVESSREKLLNMLSEAKVAFSKVENYYQNYVSTKEAYYRIPTPKMPNLAVVICLTLLLCIMLPPIFLGNKPPYSFMGIIVFVMCMYYLGAKKYYFEKMGQQEMLAQECETLHSAYEKEMKKACDNAEFIPPDYRYLSAIESFYKYVNNRRADNLRQAMNLYEEEMHRLRLENTQEAMLRESKKQSSLQAQNLAVNSLNLLKK